MKMLSVPLASCLLLASLSQGALADGERGTPGEAQGYAGREAQAPVLADFQGGCMSEEMMWFFLITAPIWIALLPVILLVYGVSSLCEKKESAPPKLPPPDAESGGARKTQEPNLKAKRARQGA